ncbi:MAG: hypothetical protein OXI77_07095 [Chloroflexota bacterium]|nr:hypothetical protein [Chloroflexota bacterium]MDE2910367.1 hypothetical protein [Chloroflexota bacterium]
MEQYVIGDEFAAIIEQLDRMEINQQTMIGTLNELLDAYRERQSQLAYHEAQIDKLD